MHVIIDVMHKSVLRVDSKPDFVELMARLSDIPPVKSAIPSNAVPYLRAS